MQVLNQAGNQASFTSADLDVRRFHQLALDFNLTSITGGTSPTFAVVVNRKGVDGTYYTVDNPAALTAIGKLSRSIGVGLAQNVSFGDTIQVLVTVTGAPTGAAWTLSVTGSEP